MTTASSPAASPVVETEVLIVGAGPAGAAAAALLSTYGIENIVLNKHGSVANAPRSHITNQRTMEVFRDLGLEKEAAAASTPQHLMGEHVWATSLSGREFGRLRTWYTHPHFKAEHDLASPTSICDLPQDLLEPILVNAAARRGSVVRVSTELLSFAQDTEGVTAQVRDRVTGTEYAIRARYLLGADGGRSVVADQLGLPLEGEMGEASSVNILFEADLTHLTAHRPGDMYWFLQPGVGHQGIGIGVLRMIRPWTLWLGNWGFDPEAGVPDMTDEWATAIAHQLIGDDTVPVTIKGISVWAVNHVFGTDNMKGRVLCAGDAVHRHSPMNGLGSNTSIQDSYNLAWKLALVLRGKAGPALLETYRDERVPVARQIVERASKSNRLMPPLFKALRVPPAADEDTLATAISNLQAPTAEGEEIRQAFDAAVKDTLMCYNTHGVELNQHYRSAAIVTGGEEEPAPPRDEEVYYHASTFPGRHLPHVWVTKNQHRVPIFDLCGKGGFTLLTGIRGAAWREAAEKVTATYGVPVRVAVIGRGGDYEDSYFDYAAIRGVADDGAILVRPDHMIAWRSATAGADPTAALEEVMGLILGLTTDG